MLTQANGAPAPAVPDTQVRVETTPSNPQANTGEQQLQLSGLTQEDGKRIVQEIITPYRTQWSADRILRIPYWLKNSEFDKGRQALSWDQATGTWFDAISWYRQNGGEEDVTHLEKYINNITQMLRKSYVAAVARGIPPVLVRPESASNLADTTTAKAAQTLITIIERMNRAKAMVRNEAMKLYLYGVYFKWTRFVIDGNWAGVRMDPMTGEKVITLPGRYICDDCAAETPDTTAGKKCENCGTAFKPENYYEAEQQSIPTVTFNEVERGMVKWSVFGPMNVDTDPTATEIKHVPLLALDVETDVAELRATFTGMQEQIAEGMESATDPNNSYARLVRMRIFSEARSATSDIFEQKVTFTQVWIQPRTYYKIAADKPFVDKLKQLFPKGMKVSMAGDLVLSVVKAQLSKEWTCCRLDEEYGMYPPAIADNVVPFNERFNNSSNIIDDWMERCATGVVLADPSRLDLTQFDGKALVGGNLTPVPTKAQGMTEPLSNAIYQFQFKFEPAVFNYQDRLINFCQLLAGVPPQVFGGGTNEGVETAKGQQQMLNQALGKLGVDWSLIKEEHTYAAQNAIECAQQNKKLMGPVWDVIGEMGSQYRNNYVHLDELNGKIRVYMDEAEGLPMSAEEKREWWLHLVEEAGAGNEFAKDFLAEPANQEMAASLTGAPDAVVPLAAQTNKTQQDIAKLLSSKPTPVIAPDGITQVTGPDGEPQWLPSIAPNKWIENYPRLKKVVQNYCQENADLQTTNPWGWKNLIAYFELACEYECQTEMYYASNANKVHQAGSPAPAQPDPTLQQAKKDLLDRAQREVDRLAELSELPPLGKNGSISGQVSAAGKILDSAVKAATQ